MILAACLGLFGACTDMIFFHMHPGAADSIIKLWDIRQPRRKRASIPLNAEPGPPLSLFLARSCPAPEDQTTRLHGVISMTVHAESNRLLASCTNSRHYLFDALRPDHGVIASYDGHESRSSFYIRAAFSPCGSHIASGSSDKSLRIWQVRRQVGVAWLGSASPYSTALFDLPSVLQSMVGLRGFASQC